jgi:hypothetical protein
MPISGRIRVVGARQGGILELWLIRLSTPLHAIFPHARTLSFHVPARCLSTCPHAVMIDVMPRAQLITK